MNAAATFQPVSGIPGLIARLERAVLGLPVCASRQGHEILNRGGYEDLHLYLSWEARQLPHALTAEYADVPAMRDWLAESATGDWSCTMPGVAVGVTYSVPPGPQTFRLASAADARALAGRFPGARPGRP